MNAALEAAAALEGIDDVSTESPYDGVQDLSDVPEALRRFVVARSYGDDVISVADAANLLQVSRPTVHRWVKQKRLIGLSSSKRGLLIPAEQILGPSTVADGVDRVLDIIEDPDLAWSFLSRRWPFADEETRPIDKLRAGKVDEVVNAAESFGASFT